MSKPETKKEETTEKVGVQVELYKPFYDFLREYMAFFGVKCSMENFCRQLIHDRINSLYDDLNKFANDNVLLEDWPKKFPYLNIVCSDDPEREQQKCVSQL